MKIDPETGVVTPLNQECCYYLAYESLTKHNTKDAQDFLKLLEKFPQPADKKIILEEGVKTLWALTYLEDKKYPEALIYMRQLKTVNALKEESDRFKPDSYYNQIRRIRSASIQLRKSLPALEEYLACMQKNTLKPTIYASLKNGWRVDLQYQVNSAVLDISYPFPSLEVQK